VDLALTPAAAAAKEIGWDEVGRMANRALCAMTTVTMALVLAQVGGVHAKIMRAEGGGNAGAVVQVADASLGDKTIPPWADF